MFGLIANNKIALEKACESGDVEVVRRLLKDERVDPSADYNKAIRYASWNGHVEVVRRLLEDKRVDSSACGNSAIRHASEFGHIEIVRLLLNDKRVTQNGVNDSISVAMKNGYAEIVDLLTGAVN